MALTLALGGPADTDLLALRLAQALRPGDALLLSGPVGAGKSRLARSLIAARLAALGRAEDIPSPSYTLVQTYALDGAELWHVDLYRLADASELAELGLDDALATAITLIEWPDRLPEPPAGALHLSLAQGDAPDARTARLEGEARWAPLLQGLAARLDRDRASARMLDRAGWGAARRHGLAGDASHRRYDRLIGADGPAVLMDSPPALEPTAPFEAMTRWLRAVGLSAPALLATDAGQGFLLLEDLGDDLFVRAVHHLPERPLYEAACDVLAHIAGQTPADLPPYDPATYRREYRLVTDWYRPGATGTPTPEAAEAELDALMAEALDLSASVTVLRDYHAENLVWLPGREGLARVGLLDYQDALVGHPAYDLVSLLEDARRDVSPALAEALLARHIAALGAEDAAFRRAYASLGAQRNLKILGVFARLARRDGKPQYLAHLPRVWGHLQRDLAAPHLAGLRAWVARWLPAATAATLARLRP